MEYNKISPKAFSGASTIKKMMGQPVSDSPFMQMADPLTGEYIDPTMAQSPQMPIDQSAYTMPMAGVQSQVRPQNNTQTYFKPNNGLQANTRPPNGVQTPVAPIYDINNQ